MIPESEYLLEEEMATHPSILAWESHGQRSVAGYSPWGRKESDTTEQLSMQEQQTGIRRGKTATTPCFLYKENRKGEEQNLKNGPRKPRVQLGHWWEEESRWRLRLGLWEENPGGCLSPQQPESRKGKV